MTKWISVKDSLPKKMQSVLIFVPKYNEIHTASFCDWEACDDWHSSFASYSHEPLFFENKDVSHWAELPKPPEDE